MWIFELFAELLIEILGTILLEYVPWYFFLALIVGILVYVLW